MLKLLIILVSSLILLAGCAGTHGAGVSADKPCAECLVCKKNADLACVDVAVDEKTPRYDYAGKTYYFCSDECRAGFAAHPDRYVSPASH